ncbi:hypothetical protein CHS0354_023712 [Potamilus streckersoni]|uniref:Uncharacterized protein n=1 Tax=Potamilus streckersoni TaxID=2493646 RepID=A0AAE0VL06_9BIVA|nr:hypothetical protein CHS0354_023712 [Potamilus streckersoni]
MREDKLRKKLQEQSLDGLIITALSNIEWLTGFTGSHGIVLLLRSGLTYFLTDFRYQEQSQEEVTTCKVIITNQSLFDEINTVGIQLTGKIGFQSENLSFEMFEQLSQKLSECTLLPVKDFCCEYVSVKCDAEIDLIQKATDITAKVFDKILGIIRPEITEKELAAEISYWNKRFGADKDSFSPIVSSGARSALPHARPTDCKIGNQTVLLIDMGCRYNGYCSDQTRTLFLGTPDNEFRSVYEIILQAHLMGISGAKAGIYGKDLDSISRNHISSKGYGEHFGHGLGHGVGLQIHEHPRINTKSQDMLTKNMVITIEPGIYLPGKFGVRIEDAIVVTESGGVSLAKTNKRLITL